MHKEYIGKTFDRSIPSKQGIVGWRSPSNIALIKYWGKYGVQLPRNPSLSISLTNAYTETTVQYETREYSSEKPSLEFYFENKPNEAFKNRLNNYLSGLIEYFPILRHLDLQINSTNSFPHSSGIASSASSMSSIALCLCSIENEFFESMDDEAFYRKASFIARLGSGSACRSVYGGFNLWGEDKTFANSSNEYAVPFTKAHKVFDKIHDDILIVSSEKKSVSSTAGHQLMEKNPYAQVRYTEAKDRLHELAEALTEGDIQTFGKIAEAEALTLHALMMSSDPSFILMEPNTLKMIKKIRQYRKETGTAIFFTLDAGPNLHILYPDEVKKEAKGFITEHLTPFCINGLQIEDQIGAGPTKLKT